MPKSPARPMLALVVSVVALACLAGSIGAAGARDRDRGHASARDRDHDGMPGRWERGHGLAPNRKSARRDPDGDKLRNLREFRLRLHPRRADTDRDGLRDRAEIRRWKTNPRRADTDGDGFKDGVEVRAGTNPRKRRSHPRRPAAPAPPRALDPPSSPDLSGWPNPSNTGVPAGWTPASTRSTSLTVTTPGAVIEDVRFTDGASIFVKANNVTIRRVELLGGLVSNENGGCFPGMRVEQTSFLPPDHAGGRLPRGRLVVRRLHSRPGEDRGAFGGIPVPVRVAR